MKNELQILNHGTNTYWSTFSPETFGEQNSTLSSYIWLVKQIFREERKGGHSMHDSNRDYYERRQHARINFVSFCFILIGMIVLCAVFTPAGFNEVKQFFRALWR